MNHSNADALSQIPGDPKWLCCGRAKWPECPAEVYVTPKCVRIAEQLEPDADDGPMCVITCTQSQGYSVAEQVTSSTVSGDNKNDSSADQVASNAVT